jgi:anti-sigma B factor antagonist
MRASVTDLSSDGRWRPLRCSVYPHRDELWVVPGGELDIESADVLRRVLGEYIEAGFPRLVLDLRDLTFIDSTGLRTIIEAGRSAGARGIDFAVSPGPPGVQRIFEVTGTAELFHAPRSH